MQRYQHWLDLLSFLPVYNPSTVSPQTETQVFIYSFIYWFIYPSVTLIPLWYIFEALWIFLALEASTIKYSAVKFVFVQCCAVWCSVKFGAELFLGTSTVTPNCTALYMGWRLSSQLPTEQCYRWCRPEFTSNVFDNINTIINFWTSWPGVWQTKDPSLWCLVYHIYNIYNLIYFDQSFR